MPEGPELHHASLFINQTCKGRVFAGKIVKSEVHKSAEVNWDHGDYTISATSRGKELKLTVTAVESQDDEKKKKSVKDTRKSLDILLQFGMSGRFHFCEVGDMEKHSHLNFYTKVEEGSPSQVLSFVDYRRFGKWTIGADWSPDRGPCVLQEYPEFREKVLNNLHDRAFNKPICEVLLNQKYFNGIGNYLRAEILYRCGIRPFDCARSVLEKLVTGDGDKKVTIKSETPDVLELCHLLPQEVVALGANGYIDSKKSLTKFTDWLQCYYNPKMKNLSDHNKRTMWFSGEPGPMVPKEGKTKGVKNGSQIVKRKSQQMIENGEELPDILQSPKKKKKTDDTKVTRRKLKEVIKEETSKETQPKPTKTTKTTKTKKIKSKEKEIQKKVKKVKSPKTSNSNETVQKVSTKSARRKNMKINKAESGAQTGDGEHTSISEDTVPMRRVTRTSSRESTNSSSSGVNGSRNGVNGQSKNKKKTTGTNLKS